MINITIITTIPALSIDAELVSWLEDKPQDGRVHSVFEHAANIETGEGRFVSILAATAHAVNGPDTVITGSLKPTHLHEGLTVRLTGQLIRFEGSHPPIDLTTAETWLGPWSWDRQDRFHATFSDINILPERITAALRNNLDALRAFLFTLWPERSEPIAHARLSPIVASIEECLRAEGPEPEQLRTTVRQLLGLGTGLTPAGDDLLIGLLAMYDRAQHLAIIHHNTAITRLSNQLRASLTDELAHGAGKTTRVSTEMLKHALNGRYNEALSDLTAAAVFGDERHRVFSSARKLCAIGHTSGPAMLTGVLIGLRSIISLLDLSVASVCRLLRGKRTLRSHCFAICSEPRSRASSVPRTPILFFSIEGSAIAEPSYPKKKVEGLGEDSSSPKYLLPDATDRSSSKGTHHDL